MFNSKKKKRKKKKERKNPSQSCMPKLDMNNLSMYPKPNWAESPIVIKFNILLISDLGCVFYMLIFYIFYSIKIIFYIKIKFFFPSLSIQLKLTVL